MNRPIAGYRPVWGLLPHLGLIRFAGVDSLSFLQGQLSNDTRRLGAGEPLLAAFSTPQGRVISVLRLLPHSGGVLAVVPREMAGMTLERLRKYVMRSKVQIEDWSERFAVIGLDDHDRVGGSEVALPAVGQGYVEQNGIGVARADAVGDRYWAVGDIQHLAHYLGDAPAAPFGQAWRLADIRAGWPQIYAPTSELFVAQMLNLDLIDGISFTKGCFTGQEIIARTQHLGRIKRRLYRLGLPPGSWAIGQPIRLADGRSGRLTEVVTGDAGVEALAVLNREPGAAGPGAGPDAADGAAPLAMIAAALLPLPYPLDPA